MEKRMERSTLGMLLRKAYSNRLSDEEKGILQEWRKCALENEELYRRLMNHTSIAEMEIWRKDFDLDRVVASIYDKVYKRKQKRLKRFAMMTAASVLLCIGLGSMYFLYISPHKTMLPSIATVIQPGTAKAILTLGDGRQVALDKKPIELHITNRQKVTADSSTLNYAVKMDTADVPTIFAPDVEIHTIEVPVGGEYNLILADGTKVWLNSETTLSFPVKFIENRREVYLKGEGYFEVMADEAMPFIVKADSRMEIRVTGTQFNIEAYDDREECRATLVEGKVKVNAGEHQIFLKPSEQLNFDKTSGKAIVKEVNVREVIAWKNGLFVFDNTPLEEIMKTLGRWYNVKVEYRQPSLKSLCFTGDLSKYDSFEAVIRMFEDTKLLKLTVVADKLILEQK